MLLVRRICQRSSPMKCLFHFFLACYLMPKMERMNILKVHLWMPWDLFLVAWSGISIMLCYSDASVT
ncbi:hypothetical protein ACS0TY_030286 [Phlomoides rotata]